MFKRSLRVETLESRVVLSSSTDGISEWFESVANHTAASTKPETPINSVLGDANHDGLFDQADLIKVLQAEKYLADQPADWSDGDWNGDGVFDQKDIVLALQDDNFESESLFAKGGKGGGKPGGGGRTHSVTRCFYMADAAGDAIQSDGVGDYCDPYYPWGDENVSALNVSTTNQEVNDLLRFEFASNITGNFEPRDFLVDLSNCADGFTCDAPFTQQLNPLIFESTETVFGWTNMVPGDSKSVSAVAHYPIANTASPNEELYLVFGGEANTPIGDVSSLCGSDSDELVLTMVTTWSPEQGASWDLHSSASDVACGIVSVETGKGKNRTITNTYLGHYHVPMTLVFYQPSAQ